MASSYNTPQKIFARAASMDSTISLVESSNKTKIERALNVWETRVKEALDHKTLSAERIREFDEKINAVRDCIQTYSDVLPDLIADILRSAGDNILRKRNIEETALEKTIVPNFLEAFDFYEQYQKELFKLMENRTMPVKDIVDAVKSHDLYKKKTKVAVSADGYLVFTTRKIILRPNDNPYGWIDNGDTPYVNLGSIQVIVNLIKGGIRIFPASREGKTCIGYEGIKSCHPHQLSHNTPCLGDFSSPISYSIDTKDIGMLLDTISLFLHKAANEDYAGRNWVKWICGTRSLTQPTDYNGNGLYIQTKPDGTVVREWRAWAPPADRVEYLKNKPLKYDFWDGEAPLHTGHIVCYGDSFRYTIVHNNKIYLLSTHPAYGVFENVREHEDGKENLYALNKEQQRYFVENYVHNNFLPLMWEASLDPTRRIQNIVFVALRQSDRIPVLCATFNDVWCRLYGPMSESVLIKTDEHTEIRDLENLDVIFEGFYFSGILTADDMGYAEENAPIKIGQLDLYGRLVASGTEVWNNSSKLVEQSDKNLYIKNDIEKLIVSRSIRSIRSSELEGFIEVFLPEWKRLGFEEQDFAPYLWNMIEDQYRTFS